MRSQINEAPAPGTVADNLTWADGPPAARRKDKSGWPVSVGGTDPVNGQSFDAMFFEHYGVNPFLDPEDDRFSTFAVDVDNASYTLARSYLQRGVLPPKEAVRVEEFVNAFRHDYAPPRDPLVADRRWAPSEQGTFAIHLEAAPSPFGSGLVLFRVGLKGKEVSMAERKPAVLTFVVDVSGSMEREDRLELVKRALLLLLDQMDRRDRVALVVYGSNARVVLPHTSLAERRVIEDAIDRLRPEGATNAEAGLREGYALADRSFERGLINRVILCSDGVANVGTTDAEGILGVVKREAGRGIYLTAVGFGMGNYNDVLMEKLADQGDGNYYYVDDLDEARRVFVENLTGTLQTIARDTKIQVEFDPDQVRRYRLLGYENRDVADRDFRNDAVDAGEVGAGHEVTALFEMKLDRDAQSGPVATVRIRYEDPETHRVTEEARTLRAEDIHSRLDSADPSFRLDAAVAEFAEILRHSYWAKDGDLARVHGLAREAARSVEDSDSARELVGLIETAKRLWPEVGPTQWRDDVRPSWEPEDNDR
jgi:Ca-activated chloride channel family protein